jgi:hypothetical protein
MRAAWPVRRGQVSVFIDWESRLTIIMDVAMLIGIKEQYIVHVCDLVTFLSVFIPREYVKYDSAWCGIVSHFKFETVFELFCLQF